MSQQRNRESSFVHHLPPSARNPPALAGSPSHLPVYFKCFRGVSQKGDSQFPPLLNLHDNVDPNDPYATTRQEVAQHEEESPPKKYAFHEVRVILKSLGNFEICQTIIRQISFYRRRLYPRRTI